ncbi:hypothetical protein RSAG8_02975, partial [Rhizoctonia solani AG-8 WAC10335]
MNLGAQPRRVTRMSYPPQANPPLNYLQVGSSPMTGPITPPPTPKAHLEYPYFPSSASSLCGCQPTCIQSDVYDGVYFSTNEPNHSGVESKGVFRNNLAVIGCWSRPVPSDASPIQSTEVVCEEIQAFMIRCSKKPSPRTKPKIIQNMIQKWFPSRTGSWSIKGFMLHFSIESPLNNAYTFCSPAA